MTNAEKARCGPAVTTTCVLIIAYVLAQAGRAVAQQQSMAGVSLIPNPAPVSSFAPELLPAAAGRAETPRPVTVSISVVGNAAAAQPGRATGGPRQITLDEAQQQAATAADPLLHLATLSVEAAKQHRLGVQSEFLPKVGSTFANLHFNKFLGPLFEVRRPFLGTTVIGLPLFYKDETLVTANAVQAVTPLFKLRQVLVIARADENIARAKAGMPVAEVAGNVEQSYFALLLAQRQRDIAEASLKKVANKWRLASASAPPGLAEQETEYLEASKTLVVAGSKVKEATAALNALLGWPLDTELELAMPPAFYEDVSAPEATEHALQTNPEVVEAEQTLVKARAAAKLAKLDYIPDVAVTGGYAYQRVMPALPGDMTYIGIMGNYTLFDFGKRERTVKERNSQVAMAETGLALVKAKVTASVTKAYYELERSRQISDLARRMNAASRVQEVKYDPEDARAAREKSESEMLQAEMEHRLAFSRLQQLIGSGLARPAH